jgi:SAM-dependent methyltransferase
MEWRRSPWTPPVPADYVDLGASRPVPDDRPGNPNSAYIDIARLFRHAGTVCGGAAVYLDPLPESVFDALHPVSGSGSVLGQLNAEAFGDGYDLAIEPFGQCTPGLLRFAAAAFGLTAGDHLVDLGCGAGGPGLWLAREHGARLTGVDFSGTALAMARQRARAQGQRAAFTHGELTGSGLPGGSADALLCVDALLYADDHTRALAEIQRLLTPGGRAVVTVTEPKGPVIGRAVSDWRPLAKRAGLRLLSAKPRPRLAKSWLRLYRLWRGNARRLRNELGLEAARHLLDEAALPPSLIERQRELVLVLGRA